MTVAIQAEDKQTRSKAPSYEALTNIHSEPCISLYTDEVLPAARPKDGLKRLREMLRGARTSFEGTSMTAEEAEKLLVSNWHQGFESARADAKGTAVFVSRDFFGKCQVPVAVGERVVVGNEFLVRPLLSLIPMHDRFFVLALSQNHVRLFEGSRSGMQERHLQRTPESLHKDLEGLSFERCYEMHTAASPSSNQKGAFFHGPSVTVKDRLIHFFRDVDSGVADLLKGQQAPLIVASVEYLFPIYQEANTYPHLLEEGIAGNPDLLSPDALHAASWKIFAKQLSNEAVRALQVYKEHVNTPLTSSNLRKVVAAADRGVVRFLFLPPIGEQWGSFVPPETVHIHEKREAGDEELLNLAAVLTLRHGGQVWVVPSGELREGAEAAAVFRF